MAFLSAQRSVQTRRAPFLTMLGKAFGVWRQRRHLEGLDAHLRRDIGVTESDVLREIDRPVWDVPNTWRF